MQGTIGGIERLEDVLAAAVEAAPKQVRGVDRYPPDVLVPDPPRERCELLHLRRAEVGSHVVLQRAQQRQEMRDGIQGEGALSYRQHDQLLATRTVEVGGGLP